MDLKKRELEREKKLGTIMIEQSPIRNPRPKTFIKNGIKLTKTPESTVFFTFMVNDVRRYNKCRAMIFSSYLADSEDQPKLYLDVSNARKCPVQWKSFFDCESEYKKWFETCALRAFKAQVRFATFTFNEENNDWESPQLGQSEEVQFSIDNSDEKQSNLADFAEKSMSFDTIRDHGNQKNDENNQEMEY